MKLIFDILNKLKILAKIPRNVYHPKILSIMVNVITGQTPMDKHFSFALSRQPGRLPIGCLSRYRDFGTLVGQADLITESLSSFNRQTLVDDSFGTES